MARARIETSRSPAARRCEGIGVARRARARIETTGRPVARVSPIATWKSARNSENVTADHVPEHARDLLMLFWHAGREGSWRLSAAAGSRLGTHRAQDIEWKVRLIADLETRRCRFSHPGRQAGERAVGLQHDDELDTAAFEPPSDLHHFAEARMVTVGDPSFSQLFVGSMSLFREPPGSREYRHPAPEDAWRSCA